MKIDNEEDSPLLVVDSSIIVKMLSVENEKHLKQVDEILQDTEQEHLFLYSPILSMYEVGNALKSKKYSLKDIRIKLHALHDLPIEFVPDSLDLSLATARIAHQHEMTYYDASFVALAAILGGTLITDNVKHQGKATECPVLAIADY